MQQLHKLILQRAQWFNGAKLHRRRLFKLLQVSATFQSLVGVPVRIVRVTAESTSVRKVEHTIARVCKNALLREALGEQNALDVLPERVAACRVSCIFVD